MRLSTLHVWRNTVNLGYFPLESVLSVIDIADETLLCIDPDFLEDMKLAHALADKFNKVRVVEFRWPENVPGDGSRIGIASQFGLNQCTGNWVLNVQADEIYSPQLSRWLSDNLENLAQSGYECFSIKVLNLEHNMQQFQGGGTWEWQNGAGYNRAIKLFRRCPKIKFAPDAWSMDGCIPALTTHLPISEEFPIVHAHDNFRDSLIQLRKTAADEIWTDRVKFGHYKAFSDNLEVTRDEWWDDPKWFRRESSFSYLLPEYVLGILGETTYRVRWEMIRNEKS